MLFVISPAKTLDFISTSPVHEESDCLFLKHAEILIQELKQLGVPDIKKLMSISDQLAELNYQRFQEWQLPFNRKKTKQALYAFKGEVYTGIDATNLDASAAEFLHKNLRILSGLYGLLHPLDNILPYRLEMGTKLENERGKDLYAFWGDIISEALDSELKEDDNILINLASNEYFKAVKHKKLGGRIITPVFKDEKNGKFKVISFFAKKARGHMVRYAAENGIDDPEQLKNFDVDGYFFNEDMSKTDEWVFTRFEQK